MNNLCIEFGVHHWRPCFRQRATSSARLQASSNDDDTDSMRPSAARARRCVAITPSQSVPTRRHSASHQTRSWIAAVSFGIATGTFIAARSAVQYRGSPDCGTPGHGRSGRAATSEFYAQDFPGRCPRPFRCAGASLRLLGRAAARLDWRRKADVFDRGGLLFWF
jgi:hypothetical protein